MSDFETQSQHAIIAGFGVPGRMVAELLEARGTPYTVVEINATTANRASKPGRRFICGDIRDSAILQRAGIETAVLLVIAIPDQAAALEATRLAHHLNPTLRIVTRTHFTSAGMEAKHLGASEVVVAEQAVAREFARILSENL
jgi:monovalent cation:H+ antiporter-2, CPA2 family